MATILTRAEKGSPLSNSEVDANFTNLNSAKIEDAPSDGKQYARKDAGWNEVTKASIGLGSVDNTADADKPVSTAQSATIAAIPINAQTGTTYTLVLADAGADVHMNNASANTVTVPPNSTVALPVGVTVFVTQVGAGQTTVAAGSGVTINADGGLKVGARYKSVALRKTATDTWLLLGGVA